MYSVKGKTRVNENIDDETFGMLFIADINSFEELHSEIEKILISDKLVENWTYPLIQPILIEESKRGRFPQTKRRARPRASTQFSARIKIKGKAAFMNNCLALFENQNLQELAYSFKIII